MDKDRFDFLFDKIYVVSLPSAIERRKNITKTLSCYGLEPTFLDGVFIDSIADEVFLQNGFWKNKDKNRDKKNFDEYRKRICGAYLAHLNALKKIFNPYEIKSQYAMILEDDIILSSDFKNKVLNLIDSLEENNAEWLCCSLQRRLYQCACQYKKSSHLYYKGTTHGHQGYIYNRYCDKKIIDNFLAVLQWGCGEEIDAFYVRLCKYFPIFGTFVPIVSQSEEFESSISLDEDYINGI